MKSKNFQIIMSACQRFLEMYQEAIETGNNALFNKANANFFDEFNFRKEEFDVITSLAIQEAIKSPESFIPSMKTIIYRFSMLEIDIQKEPELITHFAYVAMVGSKIRDIFYQVMYHVSENT